MSNCANKQISAADRNFILTRLEPLLRKHLTNEKILLTGGTGFFGKWLTQALTIANDELNLNNQITLLSRDRKTALTNLPWLNQRPDIKWVESDIRTWNTESTETVYTSIVHGAAAASQSLNQDQPKVMFETIAEGTRKITSLAAKSERVLFISSGAVYGRQDPSLPLVSEDSPLNASLPSSAYADAKRSAERLILEKIENASVTIARCFAFVGPYLPLDQHFAAGNFIDKALNRKPIQIKGDGTPLRSYLYAADLVVWLITIFLEGKSKSIYNVGSDKAVSIAELAQKFSHTVSPKLPVEIALSPTPGKPIERYVPAISKAQNELGLSIWTSLDEAITKTLDWYRP